MSMDDFVYPAVPENFPVRAILPVLVTWHAGKMGHLVAEPSHHVAAAHSVIEAIGPIGGNDSVMLVDQHERILLYINQGLQFRYVFHISANMS